ncbi:uncharacterized protein EMPS_01568 [Entomortierella parvispora]|uniref:HCP-like protein n=1 Tax=Entomortierella parvispora TaxID=205924 RepID=A0A9P3H384_9FUNG|nr:uncharacterized protein EMPS_01568 [Entomortierella parvispora]
MAQVIKLTTIMKWRWSRRRKSAHYPDNLRRQGSPPQVDRHPISAIVSPPSTEQTEHHLPSSHPDSSQLPPAQSVPRSVEQEPNDGQPQQSQSLELRESWTQRTLHKLKLLSPFSKKGTSFQVLLVKRPFSSRQVIERKPPRRHTSFIPHSNHPQDNLRIVYTGENQEDIEDLVDLLPYYDPVSVGQDDSLHRIVLVAGPEHFYHLALQLETSPRIEHQIYSKDLFVRAAGLGYALAQFKLGICYELGLTHFPMDPSKSFAWYKRAALQGHADAELAVSGWYLTGHPQGLVQSEPLAYEWASKAALRGWSKAEYTLGHYHEVGIGVPQDLAIAKQWYIKAAARGNERALLRLLVGHVGLEVDYAHLKDALLAENGTNPYMVHQLAQFHELQEYGLVPDEDAAFELYVASAHANYAPAQYKLGACYEFGILGCPQDPVQAVHWYSQGADNGHVEALLALAGFFLDGSAGRAAIQSDEEAFRFVRAAAQRGVPKAEYITGFFLEYGLGVERDAIEAMKWYHLACAKGVDSAERRLNDLERSTVSAGIKQS